MRSAPYLGCFAVAGVVVDNKPGTPAFSGGRHPELVMRSTLLGGQNPQFAYGNMNEYDGFLGEKINPGNWNLGETCAVITGWSGEDAWTQINHPMVLQV